MGLAKAQNPNWTPMPAKITNHMDDLAHVDGLKRDTYVPKYGTASNPMSQPAPVAPTPPPTDPTQMGQITPMYSDVPTERNPRGITGADTINPEYTGYDKDDYEYDIENKPADLGAPMPGGEGTPPREAPPMAEQPSARPNPNAPQTQYLGPLPMQTTIAARPPYDPKPDENSS